MKANINFLFFLSSFFSFLLTVKSTEYWNGRSETLLVGGQPQVNVVLLQDVPGLVVHNIEVLLKFNITRKGRLCEKSLCLHCLSRHGNTRLIAMVEVKLLASHDRI